MPAQSQTSPVPDQDRKQTSALRLVRFRLRLTLLTMAILPMGLSMAAIIVALGPTPTDRSKLILVVMVALTLLMVAMTVWMTRQILRPAEEIERSRHEITQKYEDARADSLRDGLTGLGNHRAFQEELDREIELYSRYKVPFALTVIDLDNLKVVNDTLGHAAGDEALQEMGRLIADVSRYADRSFRIGGDEFAILMPHTDLEGAQ